MSKHVATVKGARYVVTPTEDGNVSTRNGVVIASFVVGQQVEFVAPEDVAVLSDESASILRIFGMNSKALEEHEAKPIHLMPGVRDYLAAYLPGLMQEDPPVPAGALPHAAIRAHFARYAQPGVEEAPSAVYVSRVPWARWDEESAQWVNNACEVDEEVFGVARKFMDNAGLQHECSTDTVEGVDDYNGKLWPFYWQHANYMVDEQGIKFITDISGSASFDPYTKNVAAFGPAFWFFCCLERYCDPATGQWYTHDGTKEGTPLFQLWGISTRPWAKLDANRRAELAAHGVSEADFHLWPECRQWDAESGQLVERPYWIHSAYVAALGEDEAGNEQMVSMSNKRHARSLNAPKVVSLGYKLNPVGTACVQGFGVLFDIVKNATKNSQSVHMGYCAQLYPSKLATASVSQPGYFMPTDYEGYAIGSTVAVGQVVHYAGNPSEWVDGLTYQLGRVECYTTRILEQADGSTVEVSGVLLEPSTLSPFVVCTSAEDAAAMTATGQAAHCYITQAAAISGETDCVIYPHDGSRTSYTDGFHPYRVQGTEYGMGINIADAGCYCILGDGITQVELAGEKRVVAADEYVYMKADVNTSMVDRYDTISTCLDKGYHAVCVEAAESGYVLNARLSAAGIVYPVAAGGMGAGSSFGHGDSVTISSEPNLPCRLEMGGCMKSRQEAGSLAANRTFYSTRLYWTTAWRI